jgi:hypothetical protein
MLEAWKQIDWDSLGEDPIYMLEFWPSLIRGQEDLIPTLVDIVGVDQIRETAQFVVPILIELLQTPDHPLHSDFLSVLEHVADLCSIREIEITNFLKQVGHEPYTSLDGFMLSPTLLLRLDQKRLRIYQGVLQGIEIYRGFLKYGDVEIQRITLALLAHFCYDYPWFYHDVLPLAVSATNPYLRAEAICALGRFGSLENDDATVQEPNDAAERTLFVRLLEGWLGADQPPPVQIAAAFVLVRSRRFPPMPRLLSVLIEAYKDGVDYVPFANGPKFRFYEHYIVLELLRKLADEGFPEAMITLFQSPNLSTQDKHRIGSQLISLVFLKFGEARRYNVWRPEYYRLGKPLNENQNRFLTLIVENDTFWKNSPNELFFFYGLPHQRSELRELIGKSQKRWTWPKF